MRNCCNFCHKPINSCCSVCPPGPRGIQGVPGSTGATGPTGATGQGEIVAYGGLFNETVTQMVVPPLNVVEKLPMPSQMPYKNVILGINSITIIEGGDYIVRKKFATLTTGGDSFMVTIALRVDGVIVPQMENNFVVNIIAISNTSDFIITLNAGDVVDFVIFSEDGGMINFQPTITPSLSLMRLGS